MIFVFFDTNMLEARHDNDCLFLSATQFSKEYHDFIKFIKEAKIQNEVNICIPDIVCSEMLSHFHSCFRSEKQSFEDTLLKHEKTFGKLLEYTYKLPKEYHLLIEELKKNLLCECENIIFAKHSTDIFFLDNLIEKSLTSIPPFSKAKKSGKDFTDAGFRDAILWETILKYETKIDDIKILFTSDTDFDNVPEIQNNNDSIRVIHNFEILKNYIEQIFHISIEDIIKERFRNDGYLVSNLIQQEKLPKSIMQVSVCDVNKVKSEDFDDVGLYEGNEYEISLKLTSDNQHYDVVVLYDFIANEILSVTVDQNWG